MNRSQIGFNILIADDSPAIRDGVNEILKTDKKVQSVKLATNGMEAIEICHGMDIDCILMDLSMPVLDGFAASKCIKQTRPALKIIIISTLITEATLIQLLLLGVDGFLMKDDIFNELPEAIATVMRCEKYLSPALNRSQLRLGGRQTEIRDSVHFTSKEKEVLLYMLHDLKISRIAEKLSLRAETIVAYQKNIVAKLETKFIE